MFLLVFALFTLYIFFLILPHGESKNGSDSSNTDTTEV